MFVFSFERSRISAGVLLLSGLACAGAEVGLETLPWTDAAWSWTQDGHKLPQINTNLSGNGPISIGGVKFRKGLCGHTGFSVVYNLDRTADSFSAMIGIDEERHPEDCGSSADVRFVVMADRKEVFRQTVRLGERPVPVRIDLRGRSQLELRGEFGKSGFPLQRVAWGDPVIRTENPEKLRAALKRNRKIHEQNLRTDVMYPPAPEWKKIRIQKIVWKEFQNAYRIENGALSAVLVPELGGRIMEFSVNGNRSLLKSSVPPADRRTVRGRVPDSAGGHFMRVQPSKSFHPNDPLLLHGKFRIEFPAEGEIRMVSSESALFQVVYEYRIRIAPESNVLEVENSLINTAPYERLLGVWSITRLDSFPLKRVLLPEGKRSSSAELHVAKHGSAVGLIRAKNEIELRVDIQEETPEDFFELRAWCKNTVIQAEAEKDSRLRIVYEGSNHAPDGNAPLHLFFCERFTELESHGPIRWLKPGERISLTERWSR